MRLHFQSILAKAKICQIYRPYIPANARISGKLFRSRVYKSMFRPIHFQMNTNYISRILPFQISQSFLRVLLPHSCFLFRINRRNIFVFFLFFLFRSRTRSPQRTLSKLMPQVFSLNYPPFRYMPIFYRKNSHLPYDVNKKFRNIYSCFPFM